MPPITTSNNGYTFADLPDGQIRAGWELVDPRQVQALEEEHDLEFLRRGGFGGSCCASGLVCVLLRTFRERK